MSVFYLEGSSPKNFPSTFTNCAAFRVHRSNIEPVATECALEVFIGNSGESNTARKEHEIIFVEEICKHHCTTLKDASRACTMIITSTKALYSSLPHIRNKIEERQAMTFKIIPPMHKQLVQVSEKPASYLRTMH